MDAWLCCVVVCIDGHICFSFAFILCSIFERYRSNTYLVFIACVHVCMYLLDYTLAEENCYFLSMEVQAISTSDEDVEGYILLRSMYYSMLLIELNRIRQ